MTDFEGSEGLNTQAVEELRKQHGYNEVKTKPVPEWKKLLKRYTDWISIIIVRTSMLVSKCDVGSALESGTKPNVAVQIVAAVVSAAVPNDGGRGWTSFVLLIIELNLICIVGWSSERNAGNAVKELEVTFRPDIDSSCPWLDCIKSPNGCLHHSCHTCVVVCSNPCMGDRPSHFPSKGWCCRLCCRHQLSANETASGRR